MTSHVSSLKIAWSLLVETHWELCLANCRAWDLPCSALRPGWACMPLTPPGRGWLGFEGLLCTSKHLVSAWHLPCLPCAFAGEIHISKYRTCFLNKAIPQINPYFQNESSSDPEYSSGFSCCLFLRPLACRPVKHDGTGPSTHPCSILIVLSCLSF